MKRRRHVGVRRRRRWLFPSVGSRLNRDAGRLAVDSIPFLGWLHYGLTAWTTRSLLIVLLVGVGPTAGIYLSGFDTGGVSLGFAVLGWVVATMAWGWFWRPRLQVQSRYPRAVFCGARFQLGYEVVNTGRRRLRDLSVGPLVFPDPTQLRLIPGRLPLLAPGERREVSALGLARRRGRFRLPPLRYDSSFPGGLWRWGHTGRQAHTLAVYPGFARLIRLDLPLGPRFRQEMDSSHRLVREALEFHGCREYREGDVLRHVHPRSSARLGIPVVKEFQSEGRGRTAVVVDTWRGAWPLSLLLPRRDPVEQVLSLAAAVVDALARTDRVLELLAAGPGLYRFVSSGRAGYLDEALEILADVSSCSRDPLARLEPLLLEEIRAIQSVCLVLTRWDRRRADLMRQLVVRQVGCKAVVVSRKPLPPEDLPDNVVVVTPRAVRRGEVVTL